MAARLRGTFLAKRKQHGISFSSHGNLYLRSEKAQCGSFRKINLPEMPDFYQFKCSRMKLLLWIRFYQHFKIFSIILNTLQHFLKILIDEDVFSFKNMIKSETLFCG